MQKLKNTIFSLALKNGQFVLMQIINKRIIAIFKDFREKDSWQDYVLSEEKILFITKACTKFFKLSKLAVHKNILPIEDLTLSDTHLYRGTTFSRIKLWENTPDELELPVFGNEKSISIRTFHRRTEERTAGYETTPISVDDYEKVKHIELSSHSYWPYFNERLFIIAELGLDYNFCPQREIMFRRPLPLVCKLYCEMQAGIVKP